MPTGHPDLDVDDEPLRRVMEEMSKGIYKIPQFQREYVWDRPDVLDLFDSIYSDYPIGSFFLWRAPSEKWEFFRDVDELDQPKVDPTSKYNLHFVLDGQQRLTSLYVTLKGLKFDGTDYSRITFDLDREEFKITDGKSDHLVPVCDIWDDKKSRELERELSDERADTLSECRDKLRDYPVSMITTGKDDFDRVIEIFERINQQGTRLSRFDIVNANIWSPEFDLREKIDEELMDDLEGQGFGPIDRGTVTQALALVIEGNCSTETQRNLETEDVKEEWPDTRDAIVYAVKYLQNRLGVKQSSFIPYEGMIPVVAFYMYESGNKFVEPGHQEYIDRWFWQTAISGRYSSSTQTSMTNDSKLFKKVIEGEDVDINFPPNVSKESLIDTNIKKSTSGLRNAFLCILARKSPLHFENSTEIELSNNYFSEFKINHHHIFPNKWLKGEGFSKSRRKSIMDITFIPKPLNQEVIRDTDPATYFTNLKEKLSKEEFEDIMESHMIPASEDSGIWDNDYEKFLEQRAELFLEEIKELIGDISGIEADVKNNPKSLIEETEEEIRDKLHDVLKESYGGSYWDHVPQDVQGHVKNRIKEARKKNTELEVNSERQKLSYCTIDEYSKIICSNFDYFENLLPSKKEVQDRFKDFADYRNAILHDRNVDTFTEKDGEIAIQWILSSIRG